MRLRSRHDGIDGLVLPQGRHIEVDGGEYAVARDLGVGRDITDADIAAHRNAGKLVVEIHLQEAAIVDLRHRIVGAQHRFRSEIEESASLGEAFGACKGTDPYGICGRRCHSAHESTVVQVQGFGIEVGHQPLGGVARREARSRKTLQLGNAVHVRGITRRDNCDHKAVGAIGTAQGNCSVPVLHPIIATFDRKPVRRFPLRFAVAMQVGVIDPVGTFLNLGKIPAVRVRDLAGAIGNERQFGAVVIGVALDIVLLEEHIGLNRIAEGRIGIPQCAADLEVAAERMAAIEGELLIFGAQLIAQVFGPEIDIVEGAGIEHANARARRYDGRRGYDALVDAAIGRQGQ